MKKVVFSELAYEDFEKMILDDLSPIYKFCKLLELGGDVGKDIYTSVQGHIIRVGEKLEEEWGFAGTQFIIYLEECCELIYRISIDDENKELTVNKLLDIKQVLQDNIEIKKNELAIVAIIRNEAAYLREWIEYHKMVGVNCFFLYDNGSTDDTRELLEKYVKEGTVTYIEYPGSELQLSAYNDAVKSFKQMVDYMAFIDGDEYIVPKEDRLIVDVLEEIFLDYKQKSARLDIEAGGVGVNWKMFGTSNYKTKQEGLLTQTYLYRAKDAYSENAHVKTICNPRCIQGFTWTSHIPSFRNGYAAITENGSYLANCHVFYDAHYDRIQINHYYTKSESEYHEKMQRGWPDQPHKNYSDSYIEEELRKRDKCNEVYDPMMLRYADRLKDCMK